MPEKRSLERVEDGGGMKTIRIYAGGYSSVRVQLFITVLKEVIATKYLQYSDNIKIEIVFINEVRKAGFSSEQLIDWLKAADIHFILNHLHQGNASWSASAIQLDLRSLENHTGYPSGIGLSCPIFLQDKYLYINALSGRNMSIPTLQILFSARFLNEENHIRAMISAFVKVI
jgi:hypothetical protein